MSEHETAKTLEEARRQLARLERRLQVEEALDRVRARALAMRHSDELASVAVVLLREQRALGIEARRSGVGIARADESAADVWTASTSPEGADVLQLSFHLPMHGHPTVDGLYDAWKRQDEWYSYDLAGDALESYMQFLAERQAGPYVGEHAELTRGLSRLVFHFFLFPQGAVSVVAPEPLPEEALQVMRRIADVFSFAYTRYLDLKKAEARAREAQIEAALERVRSRTMAMHKSEELAEVAVVLFDQLEGLGLEMYWCWFSMIDEEKDYFDMWFTTPGGKLNPINFHIPIRGNRIVEKGYALWKKGVPYFSKVWKGEEARVWMSYLRELSGRSAFMELSEGGFVNTDACFAYGTVGITTFEALDEEALQALQRFAKVFEQTYTRFLDLKKAEEQAREAQIEAALERVRARSIGMRHSDELSEVTGVVFEQFEGLGLNPVYAGVAIIEDEAGYADLWLTAFGGGINPVRIQLPLTGHPQVEKNRAAWRRGDPFLSWVVEGGEAVQAQAEAYAALTGDPHFLLASPAERQEHLEACHTYGTLSLVSFEAISPETGAILQRFARVFEQTYTRFLDLKKAEAQTREAQIEAALERVRAKAMAMHSSEDLAATISAFFSELKALGITPLRCGVGLIDGETRLCELITSTTTEQGEALALVGEVTLVGHPVWEAIFEHWTRQEEYHAVLQGQDIKSYYQRLKPNLAVPDWQDALVQHGYFFYFPEGGLYAWAETAFTEDELRVFRKFSSVLGLTYRRYLDLKQAEARAREAVRDASLDRVRAEIASMRNAHDLQRITPLVWRELTTLGVPFFRCGVFIIDDHAGRIHAYLSTPQGASLAALHLPFDSAETTREAVAHWRRRQVYTDRWDRQQFLAWVASMQAQGRLDDADAYQGGDEPPEQLALQFVPFTQGMLYVGSTAPLSADQVDLVRALADAFSVAYARYEDFRRLEGAKAEVEAALEDLRSTQAQLVQSEKMASLGQLTAGIAHEIKNPLNFVNNFAQLTVELASELHEEMAAHPDKTLAEAAGDLGDLLDDLKMNAEKIHHHGARADGIVQSMMQHARGGERQRRPTNVNALVEEYVNLAFHGMRASTPDFNVTIERAYDEEVPRVEMVPQEIGRVLINLLSNAFYAVHQRAEAEEGGYAPTVTVSTRQVGSTVEICVGDNGAGIPEAIRAKIFEPFFTTKPTGTGTGLGLSISYDIVTQGHGGVLAVESTRGAGTTFTLTLPNP